MNRRLLPLAFLLSVGASSAWAQVHVQIELGLPVAPPLVVIRPGIQVVEGFGEEVFFSDGWYWCRRHDGWYRARSPRARFGWVEERRVPRRLIEVPRGQYRNWHHERGMERREERRDERRMERREDRREDRRREERGRERREERHEERDERDHRRDH
ncbi:hypothetical protein GETHLI_21330 [Geothrix limicola]|uniref:SH3 domain-containing protein n=1 Tax=Geothrix limicola TaxID=2927978 RepID=A0ABQ5QH18_9BACT|nr:hypothetical protein [Geothrix limicola]GLH73631.1 hypothetical protein GETHLI_21330 [Geothrix limicola]